ncbi:RNA-binding cell elongation regulator Jag/EloR [Lactiplantibacillus sp. WILCCON 0030]|uniref:RNA-binding protein KhpB n=1 Tax=Lactiplantibacillus brownii TaxID=3069269 RepID=A0ABU1AEJ9_9LACO|nr:RNA-binding cell elongation regulator Jag/EloR [Lactiplantibacillus brownii]MDQ7938722.1 RNA-binding cell elongation regulator Jag/EloR [Lactiplantibacillus brownii]
MTVFEGNTVAAATAAGLKQMHLTRDQVELEVVAEPKKGFLGLGKQAAQVRLTAKPQSAAPASATEQPVKSATRPASAAAAVKNQPKVTAKPVAQPKPQSVSKLAPASTQSVVSSAAKVVIATSAANSSVAASATPERTPEQIAARQAANEQAVRDLSAYLLEIVKQLGITADLDVDFGNRYATLNFDTEKQGLLIGKHGRTINALQDLAQVYMNHHGASHVNVVLDVDDYRERREETLQRLAESTAREAIATGKQVFLDPMPSFERKLIHAELANNRHVTTFSEGRDPHRAVVVAARK